MELMVKMPKAKNTFTGRCCLSFEQFEVLKTMVGSGSLKLIFHDAVVRTIPVEQWMIDHAEARYSGEEYMLVTYSKNRYQNDRLTAKRFALKTA